MLIYIPLAIQYTHLFYLSSPFVQFQRPFAEQRAGTALFLKKETEVNPPPNNNFMLPAVL